MRIRERVDLDLVRSFRVALLAYDAVLYGFKIFSSFAAIWTIDLRKSLHCCLDPVDPRSTRSNNGPVSQY